MSGVRVRAPPGSWRLLGPAAIGWAATAAMIALPGTARWVALGVALLCAAVAVWALRSLRGRIALRIVAVACAVLVLLAVRVDAGEHARAAPELSEPASERGAVRCQGTLASYPSTKASPTGDVRWVRANCDTQRGTVPVLLWLDAPPGAGWAPGLPVRAEGTISALEPTSSAAYGIAVRVIEVGPSQTWRERFGSLSAELRVGLRDRAAPMPGAELVPGFAVGDTSLVGDELEQAMLVSSLQHLVAVSGSNCALVTAAVLAIAGGLGAGRRLKVVLAASGLVGFVVIVGPDASVQRAAVMAAVVLVSSFGGKRAVALPALGLAMLVLLLADPWQAFAAGFALSVAATAGILLLAPVLRGGLARVPYLPQWIALPIALAVASQIACGPLLLLLSPGIPAAGVLANVIAAPAAPMGTGLGLLALLLLPLGAAGDALGGAALWAASLTARWVAATAEVTAGLPFATLAWPEGWPGALLLAAVESAAILAWALVTERVSFGKLRKAPRRLWGAPPTQPRAFRTVVALLVGASAGVFVAVVTATPLAERASVPRDWVVVACDVGQGDAILVRDPAAPRDVMLIDTGDDETLLSSCLDRFGVSSIALLVLTHDDRDHVGALAAVAGRTDAALIAPDVASDMAQGAGDAPCAAASMRPGSRTQSASRACAAAPRGSHGACSPQCRASPPTARTVRASCCASKRRASRCSRSATPGQSSTVACSGETRPSRSIS